MKRSSKGPIRRNGNVILIPDLETRLLKKAAVLVEGKKYMEARPLFSKLLDLDAHNTKGLYGLAICSVELGDYPQAEDAVRQLLEDGTPYYYDVLRLYLTILIEKRDYPAALREIRQIEKKKGFSREFSVFLRQMSEFCELRLCEPWQTAKKGMTEQTGRKAEENTIPDVSLDLSLLENVDPENRMIMIRSLAGRLSRKSLPQIERLLLDEHQNSEMKTMLLCMIKESGLVEKIKVRKFGKVYDAKFDHHFLYKAFADQIEEQIRQVLNSENPTLADLAVEMGRFFTMHVYPKPITPSSVNVWAAVFSVQAARAGSMEEDAADFLELFNVSENEFQDACRMIHEIEQYGI